jgi:hypothetical protein
LGDTTKLEGTCLKEVLPKLVEARWNRAPCTISEQRNSMDGKIVFEGDNPRRGLQKRANFPINATGGHVTSAMA